MNNIKELIQELTEYQPGLKVVDENKKILEGKLLVNKEHDNFIVNRFFDIRIEINEDLVYWSDVFEIGNYIEKDYHHKYQNGKLCLSTGIDLLTANVQKNSLASFCKDFIEPYLYSYEYYKAYGFFPFGDREHATDGILSSYKDITGICDFNQLAKFIVDVVENKYVYRGHLPCPCGSMKKTRHCHPKIRNLVDNPIVQKQIVLDWTRIMEKQNENKRKAKYRRPS